MLTLFYSVSIYFYFLGLRLASLFNPKAKKWIRGRKGWKAKLDWAIQQKIPQNSHRVWVHAASSGEFEQAKPIIEDLKKQYPDVSIIVTFFSPSGFESAEKYPLANLVFYLPLDTPKNAKSFIDILKPSLVLWIKYEYWWYFLKQLSHSRIPLLMISAIFQERQPFFKWYGHLHRRMLDMFTHIFVQDNPSLGLLEKMGTKNKVTLSGDTRFDRVVEIAKNWQPIENIEAWIQDSQKVVIAGSTWPDDEKVMRHYVAGSKNVKWIIVPHHVEPFYIDQTKKLFPDSICYSKFDAEADKDSKVIIVDKIGLLSRLYKYGNICFIGGGFASTGVHNTLEAATFGKPIVFGPEYEEYAEAVGLVKTGGAYSVSTVLEWEDLVGKLLTDTQLQEYVGLRARAYVERNSGATNVIMGFIYKNRLLTSL